MALIGKLLPIMKRIMTVYTHGALMNVMQASGAKIADFAV
jgi:hypothetical protein